MFGLRPIPLRLLPDRMLVRTTDGRGGYNEPVPVCHVRFDRAEGVVAEEHRDADAGHGVVFVDYVNSVGAFEVPAGSRVEIDGQSLYVTEVKRFRTVYGRIHHWELSVR